jgi:hypothetical protein
MQQSSQDSQQLAQHGDPGKQHSSQQGEPGKQHSSQQGEHAAQQSPAGCVVLPGRTSAHVEPDTSSTKARAAPAYHFVCIMCLRKILIWLEKTHGQRGGGEVASKAAGGVH